MTSVGAGGVVISRWAKSRRFHKDYDRLDNTLRDLVDQKLQDLALAQRPPGLRFEKLKGYSDPDVYSIHINGNYKATFEIEGNRAFMRRVADHDEIDRAP